MSEWTIWRRRRREAEFYKEKAEENIRYKYLYLRLGGEMYEVLEILRRTPCACAPLQEAESRLRQMLEQADEDDCQKGVYDFFRKKKGRPPKRASGLVERGGQGPANTPRSWHPNGLRPSRRAPGAPVTAPPCVRTA